MFDVEAINDVLISSLTMQVFNGTSEIFIFTGIGSFMDKMTEEKSWTQIFSSSYTSSDSEFNPMRMTTRTYPGYTSNLSLLIFSLGSNNNRFY